MTTLGILSLSNDGDYVGQNADFGPGIAGACHYDSAPIWRQVPGAWADNVVSGDATCEGAYVKAAQELVEEGADAITCDCGFTIRYQNAIAAAVSVPVSTSSLLLLPKLLLEVPKSHRIAVLTADTRCLDSGIFGALGITDRSRLVIEGLEGTATHAYMWSEKGTVGVEEVLADTDNIIERVRSVENVAAVLCECTIFVRVSSRIRRLTGLPVYDAANNAALLMASRRPGRMG
ncbi:hypothetical protein GOL41_31705 [Sinorhizobium medicae]|uniref:Asp/Glu/Hydantoin racemase superfamily protein n=1 Tax=Rhizobium meliloti TaxID=382 RepID=I2E1Z8_RHIML|nr:MULTISPECIES: hypothetical protein [Sinorhizobium]AFJ91516.1 Asp/Glu/Hydantoin racemase superfamily protein [Sinorhizobium meliloti]MDX1054197.1 hypothetical protein [Sinorhizobium medicae]MQW41568.1 hypothetical protein [Sinorhizobium meliloti]WQO62305.1 hypothetical protein U8C35_28450 [Sinorhizobium medicae]